MRLETIAVDADYNKTKLVTYVVDGDRWSRLRDYTPQDIRILKAALEAAIPMLTPATRTIGGTKRARLAAEAALEQVK